MTDKTDDAWKVVIMTIVGLSIACALGKFIFFINDTVSKQEVARAQIINGVVQHHFIIEQFKTSDEYKLTINGVDYDVDSNVFNATHDGDEVRIKANGNLLLDLVVTKSVIH